MKGLPIGIFLPELKGITRQAPKEIYHGEDPIAFGSLYMADICAEGRVQVYVSKESLGKHFVAPWKRFLQLHVTLFEEVSGVLCCDGIQARYVAI